MKAIFGFLFVLTVLTSGCSGGGWWKGLAAGRTAGVDDLPAGSMPASRIGAVEPYHYHSYESWSGVEVKESRTLVWVEEVYHLDGRVSRRVVKQPYRYSGKYTKVVYYRAPTIDDPRGWKVAGTIYWPNRKVR